MALNTVSSDRLSTNVKTSNLGTELSKKVGQKKNLIINGAMKVAQRGTSSTTNGFGSVDRFAGQHSGTDESPTQAQVDVASGTTPYTLGFRKAFRITNGNQTSGTGATDLINIQHKLEAQDIANSGWNYTSASSYITLSFWIKSSVAQSFKGFLRTKDGTEQRYAFETGSLSADTWTKITKTIPGNSNLTFDNNNGEGVQINIAAFWGTDYTDNSVTENVWAAHSSGARMKDNTSTWYTTNDATLEITGVQLEVGSVATDFEHRSFQDEMQRCRRYYLRLIDGDNQALANFTGFTATSGYAMITAPVQMRATPSLVQSTGTDYYRALFANGQTDFFDGFYAVWKAHKNVITISVDGQNISHGPAASFFVNSNNASASLAFNSEL